MSKSAHWKSTYVLRSLPKCSRCKQEFNLVAARYELRNGQYKIVEEWECSKCGKVVPRNMIRENGFHKDEEKLKEWCENDHKAKRRREERDSK